MSRVKKRIERFGFVFKNITQPSVSRFCARVSGHHPGGGMKKCASATEADVLPTMPEARGSRAPTEPASCSHASSSILLPLAQTEGVPRLTSPLRHALRMDHGDSAALEVHCDLLVVLGEGEELLNGIRLADRGGEPPRLGRLLPVVEGMMHNGPTLARAKCSADAAAVLGGGTLAFGRPVDNPSPSRCCATGPSLSRKGERGLARLPHSHYCAPRA
jgi:hypothetical protein